MIGPVLSGLRILELGHFVAAPFCARLLADLGAEVVKVEPRAGDPVRDWGAKVDDRSLWWSMHGRNKHSVVIDLKTARGRELVLDLVGCCDAVVENFRPGQLERLGLAPATMRERRPGLVVARISGYGQTGPGRDRAAFGVIGEAVGGLRHLTDQVPGTSPLPPVRVGVSIGDSIAGLYTAFGVACALWQRDRAGGDAEGRTIDVALTESVLSMMEGMLPEYGGLGRIKAPTGGGIATAAPSNAYPTRDGQWVLIAANSEPLFAKLARLIGRPELIGAPGYDSNSARVAQAGILDEMIGQWSVAFDAPALVALLSSADIPNSKVYTAADCAGDEQYRARSMVRDVPDPHFGSVLQAGIVPHVPEGPGEIRWAGPDIGEHTAEVLRRLLGKTEAEVRMLDKEGVIQCRP